MLSQSRVVISIPSGSVQAEFIGVPHLLLFLCWIDASAKHGRYNGIGKFHSGRGNEGEQ
jgi:hypothetical protein